MKKVFATIFMFFTLFSILKAQDIPITITDNAGGTKQINFGLSSTATDGIDGSLGETERPPSPPSGIFDARFIGDDIGINIGQGLLKDYRQGGVSFNGTKTHEIKYQTGNGTTITISWNLPTGVSGVLQDLLGGVIVNVTMNGSGSTTVQNPGVISKLKMIITYAPAQLSWVSFLPDTTIYVGNTLKWTYKAIAPDGDAVTYKFASNFPAGETSIDATTGVFIWTPKTASPFLVIVPVEATNGTNTIETQASVLIKAVTTVSINTPNGGENWEIGSSHTIYWEDNIDENVKIELINGNTVVKTIISSTASDGNYDWFIDENISPGNNYKIKITSVIDNSINDISNNPFTISEEKEITVISPNGGENWEIGSSHTIYWEDNIDENVKIELINGNTVVKTIISSTASDGNYDWFIDSNISLGNNYKIKITSVIDNSINDISNNPFTISEKKEITVISPNGGENWEIGSSHTIYWEDNIDENVKIELINGNTVVKTIISSTASDGNYDWFIDSNISLGNNYKIKITSVIDNSIFDISNNPFTISEKKEITVISPNGGENWKVDSSYTITWNDNIDEDIRIELLDNDTVIKEIISDTESNGNYDCLIDSDIPLGNNYKIKITSLSDTTISDISNSTFTIDSVVVGINYEIPISKFSLSQNYPNPFNPTTTIKYQIPEQSFVTIKIYNALGKEISTIVNGEKPAGSYSVNFNASHLSSGVYFYRLEVYAPGRTGEFTDTKRMLLIK